MDTKYTIELVPVDLETGEAMEIRREDDDMDLQTALITLSPWDEPDPSPQPVPIAFGQRAAIAHPVDPPPVHRPEQRTMARDRQMGVTPDWVSIQQPATDPLNRTTTENRGLRTAIRASDPEMVPTPAISKFLDLGTIELPDGSGLGRKVFPDLRLSEIQARCPQLLAAFKYYDEEGNRHNQPLLQLPDASEQAVLELLHAALFQNYEYREHTVNANGKSSLLLHCQILKLAKDFKLPELEQHARFNVDHELTRTAFLGEPPIDFFAAIRFVYTKLRCEEGLRLSLAHYCVSCFFTHCLHDRDDFVQAYFQSLAFHKDLFRANMQSDFTADSARAILNLNVCDHPIHRTYEAEILGSTDFRCDLHSASVADSDLEATPRARAVSDKTLNPVDERFILTAEDLYSTSGSDSETSSTVPHSPASTGSRGSWVDVDSDADWSDIELPEGRNAVSFDSIAASLGRALPTNNNNNPRATSQQQPAGSTFIPWASITLPDRSRGPSTSTSTSTSTGTGTGTGNAGGQSNSARLNRRNRLRDTCVLRERPATEAVPTAIPIDPRLLDDQISLGPAIYADWFATDDDSSDQYRSHNASVDTLDSDALVFFYADDYVDHPNRAREH